MDEAKEVLISSRASGRHATWRVTSTVCYCSVQGPHIGRETITQTKDPKPCDTEPWGCQSPKTLNPGWGFKALRVLGSRSPVALNPRLPRAPGGRSSLAVDAVIAIGLELDQQGLDVIVGSAT